MQFLELLKLKLGENSFQISEVMIHDMRESKRINNFCKNTEKSDEFSLDATIVSHLFWPPLKEEKFLLPKIIEE